MKPQEMLRPLGVCAFALSMLAPAQAQTAPATAEASLAKASAAFSPSKPVNSITLNAAAEWIAGSTDEKGNVTLTANADGSFTVQLNLGQHSRTESQTSFSAGQSCAWSGADGVVHAAPAHNCMGGAAWFLPEVALFGNQQPGALATAIQNSAASDSAGLLDIRQQAIPPGKLSSRDTALLTHLSATDLYLDPATHLPSALAFNIHPDKNANVDIPVQVVFTNYQTVNGVSVPFHIQKYINSGLVLDLQVQSASVN